MNSLSIRYLIFVALLWVANAQQASLIHGQNVIPDDSQAEPKIYLNLAMSTMGGKQFWTDMVHLQGYRIQRNSQSGHCRVLDPSDTRLAWGNMAGCQQELQRFATERNLQPMDGRVVVVLHGLSRTRSAMQSISDHIAGEGLQVINMSYASGRGGVEEHAAALHNVIRNLPDVDEIDFVGHSMGSIIVRFYIGKYGNDPRFRRMVMLGPPNHGSALAGWLKRNLVFLAVTGHAGQQMNAKFEEISAMLATPEFEFAIIAGAMDAEGGISNPLIPGENDLVVGVNETRLAGARDFMSGNFWHSTMMNDPTVQQSTVNFLLNGYLQSADQLDPIPATIEKNIDENRDKQP